MKKTLLILSTIHLAFTSMAQSPGGISSGLKAWLKADAGTSITTNGAPVSTWNDQSGQGRHHTQTNTTYQPTYVAAGDLMNYQPALRFDGSNDFMSVLNYMNFSTSSPQVFVVSKRGAISDYQCMYSMYMHLIHAGWYPYSPSSWNAFNNPLATAKPNNPPFAISSHIFNLGTGTGENVSAIYWNGTKKTGSPINYMASSAQYNLGRNAGSASYYFRGDIQEVIVYESPRNTNINANTLNRIQSYLALKYGISLDPASQPNYIASDGTTQFWTGGVNPGYQNNIFGLGRDSGSAVYQRQAFSYGDSSISMFLGNNLAGLNSANTNTITTDRSFLMLGDNGLSGFDNSTIQASGTTFANDTLSSPINIISKRKWKAQTTNQGTWTVNINANKYGFATYLLVSNSPTFPAGANTRIYPVVSGVSSNVTINNGDYLAFTSFAVGPGGVGLNLEVWLRADQGTNTTTTGAPVSSWDDQSGKDRNHTQSTVASQPIYIGAGGGTPMNYNPAVRFDGSNDFLTIPRYMNFATTSPQVFVVSRVRAISGYQLTYSMWQDLIHAGWYPNSPLSYIGGASPLATAKPNNPRYALASHIFNLGTGTAPNVSTLFWNGTKTVGTAVNYVTSSSQYVIGRNAESANYHFNGDIQEIIVYSSPRSTNIDNNSLARIQSYLAVKYGISLDSTEQPNYIASDNSTQFWTGTSNIGYRNNIFGLGRDDNSRLLQTQAYSVSDSSLSIYLGNTLAALNSLNPNTIAADHSFLMLGDNNLSGSTIYGTFPEGTSFANTLSTGIVNGRYSRIWKSQTATQDSWTVNINTNKFGASNDPSTTTYLMVSSTPAFTPANTRLYPIINGTANDVVINNAEYLSIATFSQSPGGVSDQIALWVRSDDGAVTGAVSSWKDNSISKNPVEVTGTMSLSAANEAHNFHPYYSSFTAANHFYDATSSVNALAVVQSSYSVFSAVRMITASGSGRIVGVDDDVTFAAEPGFSISAAKPYFYKYTGTTNSQAHSTSLTQNKSSVVTFNASNTATAASALLIGLDGIQEAKPRIGTFNMVYQRLRIGYGEWDINAAFPGDIMEVIWYNKALSTDEANRVQTYLAIKNGTTLGNTSVPFSYINTSSATVWTGSTTFQNHIAGLGRDDIEALYQKQSRSVNPNTNGQVTISLGTLAANNVANTSAISKNQTYLIWGDNGVTTPLATAATAFTYNGSTLNQRTNRIWKVQNTNITNTVQITIPITMLGTTGNAALTNSCQKLQLITATDDGITNITSTANLVASGSNYTCLYTFPAGTSYFTFGRLEESSEGIVHLPYQTTPSIYNSDCEEGGWRYWYADGALNDHSGTKRIFAIHRNGNGNSTTLNNFTGSVNYNNGPIPYEVSDGTNTTRIMSRTLTINGTGGPYTVNGGMKVRFYIDSSEVRDAILPDYISAKWFKHESAEPPTLNDQTSRTLTTAQFFSSLNSGTQDGVYYVEYANVQTFSTFGFISNEGASVPLPLTLISFNAVKMDNGHVKANWKTTNEKNISHFDLQRSSDGKTWQHVGTIKSGNTSASGYSYIDLHPLDAKSYYRLQINSSNGGDVTYSPIRAINNGKTGMGTYMVYPNPAGDYVNVSWNNEQLQPAGIKIYNAQGQLLDVVSSMEDGQLTLNIRQLPAGIYYMTLLDKAGNSQSKVIHKQ